MGAVVLMDPQEAKELLRPMRQALADHLAGLDIQSGEQGRRAMALVVVRHGSGAPLSSSAGLGACDPMPGIVALLVDAQHQRLVGCIEVEPNDVGDLVGEFGDRERV